MICRTAEVWFSKKLSKITLADSTFTRLVVGHGNLEKYHYRSRNFCRNFAASVFRSPVHLVSAVCSELSGKFPFRRWLNRKIRFHSEAIPMSKNVCGQVDSLGRVDHFQSKFTQLKRSVRLPWVSVHLKQRPVLVCLSMISSWLKFYRLVFLLRGV